MSLVVSLVVLVIGDKLEVGSLEVALEEIGADVLAVADDRRSLFSPTPSLYRYVSATSFCLERLVRSVDLFFRLCLYSKRDISAFNLGFFRLL